MAAHHYEISDLVDLARLQELMDHFSQATAIPVGLVDHTGKFLIKSGWQDLCTMFHHKHPVANQQCQQNEKNILTHVGLGEYTTFRCENGLREIAMPIMVQNTHIATLFLGQFLFDDDSIDSDQFTEQARTFGFDESEYLAALKQVPVYSHEKVSHMINFYRSLVSLTTDMEIFSTRLQRSEQALRKNEEDYRLLVEQINSIILRLDTDGRIIFMNDYGQAFFGYSPEELNEPSVIDTIVFEKDGAEYTVSAILEDILEHPDDDSSYESEIIKKNGDHAWILWNSRPLYDQHHTLIEILCVGTDMTEQRKIRDSLIKNESRLLAAQRLAHMGNYEFVLPDGEATWSPEIYDFLKLDPSQKALPMNLAFSYVHPDDMPLAESVLNHAIEHRSQLDVSFRLVPPGHDPVHIRTIGQIVQAPHDGPLIMFGIMMDITENKLAEKRITKSLEEKEVLLREIHHRVKNNFQIISSLLSLQADNITDPQQHSLFETAINRIKTMSLMHEHLYQSNNLAEISADEYLTRVCQNVTRIVHPTDSITLTTMIEPLPLPIDNAIYFGLIVNELVSNAYRHGFPNGGPGRINIEMKALENQYCLTIFDTGNGFPEGYDWREKSGLGLRLVSSLVERQLNGTIELVDPARASFLMSFPVSELTKR